MAVQGMTESLAGLDISKDKTPDYKKLIEYGLDAKVADKLDEIYKVGIIKFNCYRAESWDSADYFDS